MEGAGMGWSSGIEDGGQGMEYRASQVKLIAIQKNVLKYIIYEGDLYEIVNYSEKQSDNMKLQVLI